MRQVAVFITVLFFIWILPLGVFIKPSQEKVACGGQRAICLCSHTEAKVKSTPVKGYGFHKSAENNKEASASGGTGHSYLAAHHLLQKLLTALVLNESTYLAYRNPFVSSIEHIPKA
jgi:hypothetical protein